MFTYILQRLLLLLPTFIGVTLIAFALIHLAPGDPAELRAGGGLGAAGAEGLSSERRGGVDQALAAWRAQYGLDRPLPLQYWRWLPPPLPNERNFQAKVSKNEWISGRRFTRSMGKMT